MGPDLRWFDLWVGGWVSPVMGIKVGTYCMEHWVLYENNELWITASKTDDALYGD